MANWEHISKQVESLLMKQQGLTVDFDLKGKIYTGTKTTLRRQDYETDAGLVEGDYQFSILCPTGQFDGVFPTPRQDKVAIGDSQYRILSIDADAIGATIKLNLGSVLS